MDKLTLKAVLVFDCEIVRRTLARYLSHTMRFEVIGQFSTVEEALHIPPASSMDIILIDALQELNYSQIARLLRRRYPTALVIAVTSFEDKSLTEAVNQGVIAGYLTHAMAGDELVSSIFSTYTRINSANG